MTFKRTAILTGGLVFAAVLAFPAFAAAAEPPRSVQVIDRIVVVVNDEIITRHELNERARVVAAQLRQQGAPSPPKAVLDKQILERMIADRVQLQFAKETGLRIDDTELDRAISRIAAENKLSLQQLRAALERDGIAFTRFREDIRNEITIARLREREVENRITVTEGEIDNFIRTHQGSAARSDEFNLSHILVTVPEKASPETIQTRRERAEQALAQIKGGTDFREVAASFSDAPDALQGGALGWRDSSRLPSLFLEAVQGLQPGEVSGILRSSNGFHILKLNQRRGSTLPVSVRQTHVRHILIKTNELVSEAEARRRLLSLKERLDNNADFAELARLHSEDASSAKGGDLGWVSPGDTVPEFEHAMDRLKPGEVSEPVRTQFGWHLIQVLERRNEDVSGARQRLEARRALRARKSDEAYQEWLRQLRDKAYIQYRLDDHS
jgi:peptidyl-prolyl cis-trans isomerase SurA